MSEVQGTIEHDMNRWITMLRSARVKAAHPDDGWVDRENNIITFCYPQFNDGVNVGDLIALGSPAWRGILSHRIVRVVSHVPSGPISKLPKMAFEEVR